MNEQTSKEITINRTHKRDLLTRSELTSVSLMSSEEIYVYVKNPLSYLLVTYINKKKPTSMQTLRKKIKLTRLDI